MAPPSQQNPELTLDGVPLLYDQDSQVADFLRRYQPIDDLVAQIEYAISTENSKSSSVGPSHIGLPRPNYPAPPPPRINQLYWPTGAARWARGYFLVPSTSAIELAGKCGTEVTFKATVNDLTLEAGMYCLPPRPVSCVDDGKYDTLFIIPIVDERYWWQFRDFGDMGKPSIGSWTELKAHFEGVLGVSLNLLSVAISSDYLYPDPEEWTRRYDNAATLLDAFAHSIGRRVVRQFDGTVDLIDWTKSAQYADDMLAVFQPWWQIAGDDMENKPVPASVKVVFPRLNCGLPSCERKFHAYTISNSSQYCSVGETTKTIHSTAWANFLDPQNNDPDNDAALNSLATKIAEDYFLSFSRYYDRTFDGIKEWLFSGFDDHLLFSFGTEDDRELVASTSIDHDANPPIAKTEISCNYLRGYFTRCVAMPGNFGVDEMLHQDDITPKLPAGIIPMSIANGDVLMPGGSCEAYVLKWDDGQGEWVRDTDCTHTVYDPYYRNCLFEQERFYCRASCENGRLEAVGENGLKKLARALVDIPKGGVLSATNGLVKLYSGELSSYGNGACDPFERDITINACNPPGSPAIPSGTFVRLYYHPDYFAWIIASAGPAPMFAEAIAADDHCPSDPGGSGSGSEGQIVEVTDAIYLPSCESFEPDKVTNPRNHRWPAGSKLLLIRKECRGGSGSGDDQEEEWQVFDVELRKYCAVVGIEDRETCLVAAGLQLGGEWCPNDEPTLACKIVDYTDCPTGSGEDSCDREWQFDPLYACCGFGSGSG